MPSDSLHGHWHTVITTYMMHIVECELGLEATGQCGSCLQLKGSSGIVCALAAGMRDKALLSQNHVKEIQRWRQQSSIF
jgi:hypothetical protein